MQKVVTFDDLSENPNMINNPDLVIKILDKYEILSLAVLHKLKQNSRLLQVYYIVILSESCGPNCCK